MTHRCDDAVAAAPDHTCSQSLMHKDLGAEEREKARAKLERRCTGLQVTMAPVKYYTVKNNRT